MIILVPFLPFITVLSVKNSSLSVKSSRGRRLSLRAGGFEELISGCVAVWPTAIYHKPDFIIHH